MKSDQLQQFSFIYMPSKLKLVWLYFLKVLRKQNMIFTILINQITIHLIKRYYREFYARYLINKMNSQRLNNTFLCHAPTYNYLLFILYLLPMEPAKADQLYSEQIKGRNFYGTITIKGKTLTLNLTQFVKGGFYTLEVAQLNIEKQFKRFLIFKKTDELYDELVLNERLQISDQNTLIMPIDITYKNRRFQLKIQLPLLQKKFSNQGEKMQNLFEVIQKLNKQKNKLEENTLRFINFRGDSSNQRYNTFQVSQNKKMIKKIGKDEWSCFNHYSPLKSKGIFYFKLKIIKTTANKHIMIGICSKQVKDKSSDIYSSPLVMSLNLSNGNLYAKGTSSAAVSGITVVQGQSVFKVQIDMSKNVISWYQNDNKLYSTEIFKDLINQNICPMIGLYSVGDTVELLDQ